MTRKKSGSKRTKRASSKPKLLQRRELASVLGVNAQTITEWTAAGCPVAQRGAPGHPYLYSEADVTEWLEAREAAARSEGPLDPLQERARKDHWQATLAEQTYKTRRRELLPAAEVEKAWTTEISAVRAKLLSLPTTYADRLFRAATLEGVAGAERLLVAAVHEVLRELAGERDGDKAA